MKLLLFIILELFNLNIYYSCSFNNNENKIIFEDSKKFMDNYVNYCKEILKENENIEQILEHCNQYHKIKK